MTREEAIKFAEYAQIMANGKPEVQEFYKMAEAALRAQQDKCGLTHEQLGRLVRNSYIEGDEDCKAGKPPLEKRSNEPLTLDELRQMDGDKVYIQFIGACKGFYDDEYAPYYGQREQYIQKYNGMLRGCDLPLKYYGESWLAYRHKPEEGN